MTDAAIPEPEDEKSPSLFKRLSQLIRGDGTANAIRESLEEVIGESDRQSRDLTDQERTIFANLLNAGERRGDDVMVPRADIIAVEETTPLDRLVALFGEAQHSRVPVYRDTLDDPTGFIHIKDALAQIEPLDEGGFRWRNVPISAIKRPVLFVPPSMPVLDLLVKM